jgi:glycosyltransferase involved in cell wall biosynthesis
MASPSPAESLPRVSAVIPTLNAEKYLDECLGALRAQDYPQDRIEIIVADAGSTDQTLEIAERHEVDRVLPNPLRTGEAGKAVGVRAATGDLVLLLDSDNVIPTTDWLRRMVAPFGEDTAVISAEPMRWEYDRGDHYINRYQALTGSAEPLSLFVGNYNRDSLLSGRWTGFPHRAEERDGWQRVEIDPENVPTIGANGYVVRRTAYEVVPFGDYLFDIDHAYELVQRGHRTVARVDVGIYHYFCDGIDRFYRKQRRRVDDFHYFSAQGQRTYPWTVRRRRAVARFVIETVLVLPLLRQAFRGMRSRRDPAWLFHVAACWITLLVYGKGTIRGWLRPRMLDRSGWAQ